MVRVRKIVENVERRNWTTAIVETRRQWEASRFGSWVTGGSSHVSIKWDFRSDRTGMGGRWSWIKFFQSDWQFRSIGNSELSGSQASSIHPSNDNDNFLPLPRLYRFRLSPLFHDADDDDDDKDESHYPRWILLLRYCSPAILGKLGTL
jgi:hypothetical protein